MSSTPGRTPTALPPRRTRAAALVTALACVLAGAVLQVGTALPAAAETVDLTRATDVQMDGRGFGHGRGLSQNGARGAARQGLDHPAILDFYYPGAERYDVGDPLVRVKITGSARSDAAGPYTALSGSLLAVDDVVTGASTALPAGTSSCTARPSGDRVRLVCGGVEVVAPAVRVRGGLGGTGLAIGSSTTRYYRGAVEVRREGSGVVGVVVSTMQEYLRGVVPVEMPPSWEPAALRAQSVAARTYALRTTADRPAGAVWDICDTTACQVFQGMRTTTGATTTVHETASTDAAVAATRGLALRYAGRPAFTQFSAANGGWSTGSSTHPYLAARPDPYDGVTGSTSHRWTTRVAVQSFASAWPAVGRPTSFTVLSRDGAGEWGGRVLTARLTGTSGSVQLTGEQLRSGLGLRSTWFVLSGGGSSDPYGSLDGVSRVPAGAVVSGWAADPDGAPVEVHVYVDGRPAGSGRTGVARPDVPASFPGAGGTSGYSFAVPLPGEGTHQVCAYAVNTGAGSSNTTLGCGTVRTGVDPVGSLDELRPGYAAVTARGWAFDADSAAATQVHVYLDGRPAATAVTSSSRTDVGRTVPGAGDGRGWGAVVAAPPGAHRVCAYGISVGGGSNALLSCQDVVVASAPVGALDAVVPMRAGVETSGWAADPDTTGTVGVHTYAAGWVGVSSTGSPRPDVAPAVGAASAQAGFTARQPALGGPQQVCSYAIDHDVAGAGSTNSLLGCRPVTVPSVAFGHLDQVSWADGRLDVRGWALDPDVVAPVSVHVYADGTLVARLDADAVRADLAAAFPLHTGRHGLQAQVGLPSRPATVCAYAIDVQRPGAAAETNPLLGCLPG